MTALRATPSGSIAPWAELVPNAPYPLTVDDMLALPDDGYIYELVDGVLLRMAGSGGRATVIGGNMYAALRAFVLPRRLGVATPADGVYKFPGAETGLIPDAGYYRAERLDRVSDQSKPLPFAPDLTVEVVSPDQTATDMAAKAQRYVRGSTRLVWVLWPDRQEVDVWRPQDRCGAHVEQSMLGRAFQRSMEGYDGVNARWDALNPGVSAFQSGPCRPTFLCDPSPFSGVTWPRDAESRFVEPAE